MELLFAGALVLAFDQATKRVVLRCLEERRRVLAGSFFRIRPLINRSGALGRVATGPAIVMLWASTSAGLLAVVYEGPFFSGTVARIALGCALGGATSNLVDRLWRGGVVDFIDLRFWPVFNLADSAIVGGVVLALLFAR